MAPTNGQVSFELNGEPVKASSDHPHLLAALREELGILSAKDGCSPSGQCGCCTILMDDKAVVSCQMSMEKAEGTAITTLEGLPDHERERLASAFAVTGALQCGFCTPGILVRVKALLDKKGSDLTSTEAAGRLGAHLCRCTGYTKIFEAVDMLAAGEIPMPHLSEGIGKNGIKYEALELALGDRPYIDDMVRPGLLHGAFKLTDHARADVKSIDTTAAEAVVGVVKVLTAADVPGDLRVGLIHKDWPVFIPEGGRTSYMGDVLAIVVAEDRQTARHAAELVKVDYEIHTPFVNAITALESDEDAVWGLDGNELSRSTYARGDADAALADSAYTLHEVFTTQRIEHAFLEPESTLAEPLEDGRLMVYSGGQGVWDDRNQIAAVLGVEPDQVIVELVS
ncbi:MAG: 2Fe-2S iron-sulfur cluster-binding protein, partial [Acidimicrobiia bacterium]|nr:2Fe-2S iron-sulfur cluster-binding protein [Acidimicrobiia bacterium]